MLTKKTHTDKDSTSHAPSASVRTDVQRTRALAHLAVVRHIAGYVGGALRHDGASRLEGGLCSCLHDIVCTAHGMVAREKGKSRNHTAHPCVATLCGALRPPTHTSYSNLRRHLRTWRQRTPGCPRALPATPLKSNNPTAAAGVRGQANGNGWQGRQTVTGATNARASPAQFSPAPPSARTCDE